MPLVGLQIDDRGAWARRPAWCKQVADRPAGPTPGPWQQEQRARYIGDKAWKHQKNPTDHCSEARGFELNRAGALARQVGPESLEIGVPIV